MVSRPNTAVGSVEEPWLVAPQLVGTTMTPGCGVGQSVSMADISEIVERFYADYLAGDVDAALALCSADAQWQSVTPGTRWSGSRPIREYLTSILPEGLAEMDGYAVESWRTRCSTSW